MTRSRTATVVALVLAATATVSWAAKPNRKVVPIAELPAWAREAIAIPTPATDAAAVILHDETIVEPLVEGGVRVTRRFAARPLKRGAIDDFETFVLGYRKDDRSPVLRGWTVPPGAGTAVAPDPATDRRDDPWTDGTSVADDFRLVRLEAANPSVGATFVSESSVVQALDLGAVQHEFGDERVPVLRSRLVVRVPSSWGTDWSSSGIREIPCSEENDTVTCAASDVPPLPPEEGRPPAEELLARIWVRWFSPDDRRGFADWESVAFWYETLSAPVLKEMGEAATWADAHRPDSPAALVAGIERAFSFVSSDIRYVSIQLGIGGFKPHPPALVVSRKFGDCKDKAFLLRAILSRWGLRTFPVVVKVRDAGLVDPEVPSAAQFNHVIAGVALPDGVLTDRWPVLDVDGVGRVLFLDGTARGWSAWTLPRGDQGTHALLVLPEGGRLVQLPFQPPEAGKVERTLDAAIDESGTLRSAVLEERLHDAAGSALRSDWAGVSDGERRRQQEAWIQSRFPGSALASYTVEGLERSGEPVVERSTLEGGWFGKRAAGMLIVSPGRAGRGLYAQKLPSTAPWGLRAVPRQETVEASILVPEGYAPEALPPEVVLESHGIDVRAAWSFEEGRLRYRRLARLTTSEVSAKDYPAFREAVRKLDAADATAVVFVKRAP